MKLRLHALLGMTFGCALVFSPMMTIHAASITLGATACQIEQQPVLTPTARADDLERSSVYGLMVLGGGRIAGDVRYVVCTLPRVSASPSSTNGVTIFVDGGNQNGTSVECTATVYDFLGNFKAALSFRNSQPRFDVALNFTAERFSTWDYAFLQCKLPVANASLFGVTVSAFT
jgi:hypothetical protein